MSLKKVSLEVSLKPFCFDMTDDGFAATARKIFRQWENLFSGKQLQLMFWTADGSELLDYSGNMDDAFEYARYVGCANFWAHQDPNTPIELQNLHQRNYLFMPNPPVWTYRDLQRLIHTLKSVYTEMYGGILEVGTTFDPGPEFAVSHFKYERHPETLSNMLGAKIFVYCYSTLDADDFHYAAYPNGVPQGTRFGTFIGKQAQCFMTDIGFDFIWFSNGFGFGTETWGMTGAVFDGSRFYPENSHKTSDLVFQFWNAISAANARNSASKRAAPISRQASILRRTPSRSVKSTKMSRIWKSRRTRHGPPWTTTSAWSLSAGCPISRNSLKEKAFRSDTTPTTHGG